MEPFGAPVAEPEKVEPDHKQIEPGQSRAEMFLMAVSDRMPQLMDQVRFGAAKNLFDRHYWTQAEEDEDTLVLRNGRSPSAAIDRLVSYSAQVEGIEGLETAKLDCAEIIEVARWLALRDVIGDEAFDTVYGDAYFALAAPGSTGIQTSMLAVRHGTDSDGDYAKDGTTLTGTFRVRQGGTGTRALEALLPGLPVGSRVMWRNFDPAVPADDDFKNENTVKLTGGRFAAHPFGVFTIDDLVDTLATGGYNDVVQAVVEARQQLVEDNALLEGVQTGELAAPAGTADRIGLRIARHTATLQRYAGVNSRADYAARYLRIIEVETFVNPLPA